MSRSKIIFSWVTSILVATSILQPIANAATEHQNGQINLRWSTTDMYLNANSFIEQEIILTENSAFVDGQAFRWISQHHFGFCWQGIVTLTTTGNRCGYVGIGLGSKSGNNYFGNLDFVLFNGIDVSTLKINPQTTCEKRMEQGYVENTMTYYIVCWHPVAIQLNTPYVMRVQYDPSNNSNSSNWWSATLTNKKTNETITIGRIKTIGNAIQEPMSSLESVYFYTGDAKPCDAVPNMDLRVAPARSNAKTNEFLGFRNSSCVRAIASKSAEFPGYVSVRLGGANPESREPGYLTSNPNPTPTPSSTPSSTQPAKPIQIEKPSKPASPVFSGIKIANNTLNINVNLNSSKPDMIYLVSPKLTLGESQKILGNIDGDIATWSIKFNPKSNLGTFPLSFISVKDGISSDETKVEYAVPAIETKSSSVTKVPPAPSQIKSKVVGTSLIVSAKVFTSGNAATEKVSLYSSALGIKSSQPVYGDLLKNSVVFSIPINSSVLTKRIDLNLVAANNVGRSPMARSSYSLPVPKSPTVESNQNVVTVICVKGPTIRTFASKSCPPGWQTK